MNDNNIVTSLVNSSRMKATYDISTVTLAVLVFLCIGSSMLFTNTKKTSATIQSTSCKNTDGSCTIIVQYTVDNQQYTNSFNTNDRTILNKTTIDIDYNTDNPNNINYNQTSPKILGIMIISFIPIVFAIFAYYYYNIMTNKDFAAQQAVNRFVRF
jgi:hypothetical protein